MNLESTIQIIIRKKIKGKIIEQYTYSLVNPPYIAKHFWLRYKGKRSNWIGTL